MARFEILGFVIIELWQNYKNQTEKQLSKNWYFPKKNISFSKSFRDWITTINRYSLNMKYMQCNCLYIYIYVSLKDDITSNARIISNMNYKHLALQCANSMHMHTAVVFREKFMRLWNVYYMYMSKLWNFWNNCNTIHKLSIHFEMINVDPDVYDISFAITSNKLL